MFFSDIEAPTPTPNRDPIAMHFTFDIPPNYHEKQSQTQYNNPEYFEACASGKDAASKGQGAIPKNSRRLNPRRDDYYNEISELGSDGGSARGSSTESTTSI